MSSENLKLFAKFAGNREQFENTEYPATYENSIVFINGNGDETKNCIYTHGEYYGTSTALDDLIDKMSNPIHVTHEELVSLRDNGQLVHGARYVITDYVTSTPSGVDESVSTYMSKEQPFNIVVTAISPNSLSEDCSAISNDTFPNADKWKLCYTINPTDDRFEWSNSKGIIYRMIDENNLDCPYDFKNIQFKRDRWSFNDIDVSADVYKNTVKKCVRAVYDKFQGADYVKGAFCTYNGQIFYNKSGEAVFSTFVNNCKNITILPTYNSDGKRRLNDNVFFGSCSDIYIDEYSFGNTFNSVNGMNIPSKCTFNFFADCSTLTIPNGTESCCFSRLNRVNCFNISQYCYIESSTNVNIQSGYYCVYDSTNVSVDNQSAYACLDNSSDILIKKSLHCILVSCNNVSCDGLDTHTELNGVSDTSYINNDIINVQGDVKVKGSATVNDKTVLVETIPVMYWELMDMCTSGMLVPGQTYKILDYECNDSFYYFSHYLYIKYISRHNIYSIIVTATSTSTLSREATLVVDNAYSSYVEGVSGIGEFDDVEVIDDGVAEVSDETKTLSSYDTYTVKYITHSDPQYKDSMFAVLNNDDIYIPTADGYKNDQYFLFEGKEEYNYSGAAMFMNEINESGEGVKNLYYCTGINAGFNYSTTLIDGKVHKANVYVFRRLNDNHVIGATVKSIDRDGSCRYCQITYISETGKYQQTGNFGVCSRSYTEGIPYLKKYNSYVYEGILSCLPEIETKRQHGVIYELKDSFGNSFPYDVLSISQIDYKHNESDSVPHITGNLPIKLSDYMVNTTVGPYTLRFNEGTDTKYYNLPVATSITEDMDERYCNIMVINTSHFDLVSNSMYVNNVKRY